MAEHDQPPRPAPDIVEPGIPAVDEVPEEMARTGETMEGEIPPLDRPQAAAEWGTTAAEQRGSEPVADRVAREEPDVLAPSEEQVRPLVEPGAEGGVPDLEPAAVGEEEPLLEDALAPEESAMRPTTELPGATDTAGPGYLEDEGPQP